MKYYIKKAHHILLISFIIVACSSQKPVVNNNYKGHLSKEQLFEIGKLIDQTENEPLSEKSEKLRITLSLWLIESPDITVRIYDTMKLNEEYKYKRLFVLQNMLTPAKILIENPDLKNDHIKIQMLTLQSLLKVYDRIIFLEGDISRNEIIEDLIVKRTNGELQEYVTKIIEKTDN